MAKKFQVHMQDLNIRHTFLINYFYNSNPYHFKSLSVLWLATLTFMSATVPFALILSICLFCLSISCPMSVAIFLRLPRTDPTCCMLSSISSSLASFVILWMYGPDPSVAPLDTAFG